MSTERSGARATEPTITVHLVDDHDRMLTACSGQPWEPPTDDQYPGVPRELCGACNLISRGWKRPDAPRQVRVPIPGWGGRTFEAEIDDIMRAPPDTGQDDVEGLTLEAIRERRQDPYSPPWGGPRTMKEFDWLLAECARLRSELDEARYGDHTVE